MRDAFRETLAGAGLAEVVTHALVSPRQLERFGPLDEPAPADGEAEPPAGRRSGSTTRSPAEHSVLRQRLIGSLLDVVSTNHRQGREDVAIFEIGKGYGAPTAPTHEWWRLGFALDRRRRAAGLEPAARAYDLDDAKGIVELLARRLGCPAGVRRGRR